MAKSDTAVSLLMKRSAEFSISYLFIPRFLTIISGHFLLRAARKAALEWKFKENFGFSENLGFSIKKPKKLRFIQAEIVFNFVD